MGKQVDLLQGTLEILILKAISLGPLHGYGMLLRIQQISGERLEIPQGSFYIALYRIEHKGWIKGEWGESENNRRAKFYRRRLLDPRSGGGRAPGVEGDGYDGEPAVAQLVVQRLPQAQVLAATAP